MPTTPNLALRYPASTDAPDGPGAFAALATDVDTAFVNRQRTMSGTVNGTAPGIVAALYTGKGAQVEVSLQATNYYYRYLLWVSHSPFNANAGQVTVLATHVLDNTAALGPVTQWTVSSGNLFATVAGAGSTAISFTSRNTLTGF